MNYLIKFTINCGEYEFRDQTVINSKEREIEKDINTYFLNFYGTDAIDDNSVCLELYSYHVGSVCVNHISYEEISDNDAEILKRLNIA